MAVGNREVPGRLAALDGLRFVAAISVVAFHYTARISPAWDGDPSQALGEVGRWTAYGRLGVPLFFIISGFVILMAAWGKDVPHFVASRVGRLFPAYWFAVALSAVITMVAWPQVAAFYGHEITKPVALLNLTMVQAAFGAPDLDGPYWTLWSELRFYLLIAVFLAIGITRRRVLAFATLWPVIGTVAATTQNSLAVAWLMPDYAPFFAGGMLLYVLYRDRRDVGVWLLLGFQVALSAVSMMGSYRIVLSQETIWTPSRAVLGLLAVAVYGLVALTTLTRLRHVGGRWLTTLGALTYPVYLLHENLGWFVIHLSRPGIGAWGAVALATSVVVALAYAVHRLVERPFGPRLRRAMAKTLAKDFAEPSTPVRDPQAPVPSPAQQSSPATGPLARPSTGPLRRPAARPDLAARGRGSDPLVTTERLLRRSAQPVEVSAPSHGSPSGHAG